jgi:hypothetical protein
VPEDEKSRIVKRLVVEVFEDGTKKIESWGWPGPQPTMVIAGSKGYPYPTIMNTELYRVDEFGAVMAYAMDQVLYVQERDEKNNG